MKLARRLLIDQETTARMEIARARLRGAAAAPRNSTRGRLARLFRIKFILEVIVKSLLSNLLIARDIDFKATKQQHNSATVVVGAR
ncbi:hypothetical protein EVAR_31990_1 [Eumeta japonica]|uniref:Uncharacterized protein n=1 Tax=Eumeta variegata TaxID=151549 RepID=A0A4C1VTK2_EUMVA|nr:hypothetical protein EVAR_31990_1 [Eumeta japonica]